ncbi:MAG TPA: ATP synthase F1 subunit gamma [Nitrospiraceae bacterium]|nr:ATP synthase F1 subunit gamma [Nitrospiraceae bacterium]
MLTLRQIRRKIVASGKTKQITRTMQMVAASRLKKSEGRMLQAKPYARKLEELLIRLSQTGQFSHPFFAVREVKNSGLIIVTSDRGLCGSYNTNIILKAESVLKGLNNNGKIILLGKKGFDYFRKRNWEILDKVVDLGGKLDQERIGNITNQAADYYLSGVVDEIYLIYTTYRSALSYKPVVVKFLNIEPPPDAQGDKDLRYIFEPGVNDIFEKLLPKYISTKVYMSLAEAFTAENAARMMAMKLATDNADEMIDRLTLMRNKARQAAITKEITEIVTSAEALK